MMAGVFGSHLNWIVAGIAAYYMCAWLLVGRARSSRSLTVRYEPPARLSPAAVRYVYTMSCDGRSYAAVIAQLAAKKLLEIIPDGATGQVTLKKLPGADHLRRGLPEEEARIFKELFEWDDQVPLKLELSMIERVQKALDAKMTAYFSRNFIWVVLGLALTDAGTTWMFLSSQTFGPDLVGEWMLALFTGFAVAMYGLFGYWTWDTNRLALTLAIRGIYRRRTLPVLLAFIFLYPALWFFLIRTVASQFAVLTTLLILLNTFAAPLLRNYTSAGRLVRDEIEGFREFIAGAELDRLRRMNEPGGRVQIDPEMIPYAIALDLKEAWGDQLGIKTMMETDL
jgi:hypothetical protein